MGCTYGHQGFLYSIPYKTLNLKVIKMKVAWRMNFQSPKVGHRSSCRQMHSAIWTLLMQVVGNNNKFKKNCVRANYNRQEILRLFNNSLIPYSLVPSCIYIPSIFLPMMYMQPDYTRPTARTYSVLFITYWHFICTNK